MRSVKRLIERIRNVPGLGRDVVAMVVLVAIGLACTGYVFSRYDWQAPWEERVLVSAEVERATGVRPESRQEVRIAGVTVGKIVGAEPLPNGNAKLTMSLEPGHTVYSNARVVLRTKSPIKVMYVALDPGGPPAKPLPEGRQIPLSQTEHPIEAWQLLGKLDERARVAITSLINQSDAALASAPKHLPQGLRATDATLQTFRPVVEQLQTRREKISQLVTSLATVSHAVGSNDKRLARLSSSLLQTLGVLAERDKELSGTLAQLPGFTGDVERAMRGASQLTKELNPALDSLHQASDKLPAALERLSTTVGTAGQLVDAARPVVSRARPVVADLRPLAGDVGTALGDLAPTTGHLPSATKRIVPWMQDLAAFIYQTSSAFSIADATGGFGRANVVFDVQDPLPGLLGSSQTPQGGGN